MYFMGLSFIDASGLACLFMHDPQATTMARIADKTTRLSSCASETEGPGLGFAMRQDYWVMVSGFACPPALALPYVFHRVSCVVRCRAGYLRPGWNLGLVDQSG